jgi:NAD-dependent dihydropyrimidine dehydrogenase PreA subunit
MTTKTTRQVVKINEDLCNGCGVCIISCAEGALKIIDGKAKLISEKYCDGLGNCLSCPQGAITIEERAAEEFDEEATREHLEKLADEPESSPAPHTCPGSAVRQLKQPVSKPAPVAKAVKSHTESRLNHWPVQLALGPANAPFLKNADLILTADCVPFAYADFQQDFLGEHTALLVACPKLDDFQAHQEKLNQILKVSGIKSLTVVHMEVPCCSGLVHMAKQAMLSSGNIIPFKDVTISVGGEQIAA